MAANCCFSLYPAPLPVLPALTSSLPESTSSPSACNAPAASFFPCYCFAEIFPVCVPNLVAESDFRFFNLPRSTFCPLLMKFGDSYLYVCAHVCVRARACCLPSTPCSSRTLSHLNTLLQYSCCPVKLDELKAVYS